MSITDGSSSGILQEGTEDDSDDQMLKSMNSLIHEHCRTSGAVGI